MSSPERDEARVQAQLGRPPRGQAAVVHRCHLSLPVVVEVAPVLPDGEPFPTRYWLTCILAHRRVARLEARGGVRELDRLAEENPSFRAALEEAHRRYAAERDAAMPKGARHRPRGGVGGSSGGVKCLHAHLGDLLAGHENPVGRRIADAVLPLDCDRPCVIPAAGEGTFVRNGEWEEPRGPG